MAVITLKNNKINTSGELPVIGSKALDFSLIDSSLKEVNLGNFSGKKILLNIFPSIDTGTCATSVRKFNEKAASLNNITILCISRDLPFAQSRFCGAEGIKNVVMLSDFKTGKFGTDYGLQIIEGPLAGLNSRSIIIVDENGNVSYTEQVKETTEEPNYDEALKYI